VKSAQQFLEDFLADRLDPRTFDHASHVRAAWLLLENKPFDEALHDYGEAIKKLASRGGSPGKFHQTITATMMSLIATHRADRPDQSWDEFCRTSEPLFSDAREVLQRYYSSEVLFSALARKVWVDHDRLALPARFDQAAR